MASEVPEEAQALMVLRRWQEMPGLGIQLVPEHVETRPLYHPRSPGLLQVREGSAPNSRTPGLTPRPGPWAPKMSVPQDLHLGSMLPPLILVPSIPTPVLGLHSGPHTFSLDSGPAGFPPLDQQGSDLALPACHQAPRIWTSGTSDLTFALNLSLLEPNP